MPDVLDRLFLTIASRRSADPAKSYTAKLISEGVERCAKKFGEEAIETALAAMKGDKSAIASESADVLYHLMVLWAASGVEPQTVYAALEAREGRSGLDEKASRR
ncbi:MAG TPA: phosphoribosyl-ATP diphosphatase [Rhizomicrobium sp.]|nr:phosphoribosyl-ATP diphosphatase [Rhizomicrobium sp.]